MQIILCKQPVAQTFALFLLALGAFHAPEAEARDKLPPVSEQQRQIWHKQMEKSCQAPITRTAVRLRSIGYRKRNSEYPATGDGLFVYFLNQKTGHTLCYRYSSFLSRSCGEFSCGR